MFVRFKEAADIAVEIRAAITMVTADRSLKKDCTECGCTVLLIV